MDPRADFASAASAWVAHLRAGGTTPWADWAQRPAGGPDADAAAGRPAGPGHPPGAAQLELLRRLNLADPRHAPSLADRLLRRAGPGRGPAELPLLWPAAPGLTVAGQAGVPVDPGTLAPGELLRVGAGLLADLVRDLPLPLAEEPPEPPRRRRSRRGRSFAVDGPPRTLAGLRAALAERGLVEHRSRLSWLGGPRPATRPDIVLVLLLPFEDLLGEVWEERARRGSARGWRRFVQGQVGRRDLPPGADPASTAARWAGRVGPGRVHLVTPDRLDDALRDLLGVRPPLRPPVRPRHRLSPAQVDVLRRHHAVQALHLHPSERQVRTDLLVGVLEELAPSGPAALAVPAGTRSWAVDRGARLAAACSDYAGPGDPAVLTRLSEDRPERLLHGEVLPVMTEAILRVATRAQEVRR